MKRNEIILDHLIHFNRLTITIAANIITAFIFTSRSIGTNIVCIQSMILIIWVYCQILLTGNCKRMLCFIVKNRFGKSKPFSCYYTDFMDTISG